MDLHSIRYGIVEEKYRYKNHVRISYGIVAYSQSDDTDLSTIIASYRDLSSDQQKMQNLVQLCNRLSLSPLHLPDVIDDFLN